MLARVVAAGHPPSAVAAVARAWEGWSPLERRQVARPLEPGPDGVLRFGRAPAVQTSPTTCGSASLVALAAAGDPVLAAWLVTGSLLGSLHEVAVVEGAPGAGAGPGARFALAQRAMQRATGRRALGPLPWPSALGTPPWTAARHARYPGYRYVHRAVDDSDDDAMDRLLAWVQGAAARGVPVPLFTGGDLAHGLATAVPRHVVLVVPDRGGGSGVLSVYEPATGRVFRVPARDLLARREPHPALGHWVHVVWAILPVASARRPGGRPATVGG